MVFGYEKNFKTHQSTVSIGIGLAAAVGASIAAFAGFNFVFLLTGLMALVGAAVLLFVVPLVVLAVFERSERLTREWVGDGMDLDVELLALMRSSAFGGTRLGGYLAQLQSRFPGPVVADMFCLLQLELELAIRAKGMLMAREAGLEVPVDDARQPRGARVSPPGDRTYGITGTASAPGHGRPR